MANSVELRLPLVDYRLVETVVGLRKAHRDIDLPPKHWLAQIGKKNLPAWVFENRKRGFEPPVEKWMSLLLQHYGQDLAEGELVKKGILKKSAAAELAKGRKEPQVIFPAFFNGLVLEQWLRSFK
jgi:asparagine synthase (glutamine-hydrolysing)